MEGNDNYANDIYTYANYADDDCADDNFADGKYAKVEILSYYQGAPDSPDAFTDQSRYYTFNYVYQPNSGETTF